MTRRVDVSREADQTGKRREWLHFDSSGCRDLFLPNMKAVLRTLLKSAIGNLQYRGCITATGMLPYSCLRRLPYQTYGFRQGPILNWVGPFFFPNPKPKKIFRRFPLPSSVISSNHYVNEEVVTRMSHRMMAANLSGTRLARSQRPLRL